MRRATTGLVMTRVKAPFPELGQGCCEGNGVRRRRWDVVTGPGVGSASGDRGRRRFRRLESEVGIAWM